MALHIRCKACKLHLAGPLSLKENLQHYELDFSDYLEVGQAKFSLKEYDYFECETPYDLIIHPQWYEHWKTSWEKEIVSGAALRPAQILIDHSSWGCCGPMGKINCQCGEILGTGFGDCHAPQWILLLNEKVERSDQVDGIWTLFSDGSVAAQWHEATGKIINGLREGEWEVWFKEIMYTKIEKRNKERKLVAVQKEERKQELVRYERWENGKRIASTDK